MNNLKRIIPFILVSALLLLPACSYISTDQGEQHNNETENNTGTEQEQPDATNEEDITENENDGEQSTGEGEQPKTVEEAAYDIVLALKDQDMNLLAQYIHPDQGVRFTPYGYVNLQDDLVFQANQMIGIMNDSTEYLWGYFDGTGDPIQLTFSDYYDRFIYDQDYLNAEQISINERLGHGNSLDNTGDVYPNATVVEFHFSGFEPQYEGMDWRSLRLVLELDGNQWYLVAIIHDEWTI